MWKLSGPCQLSVFCAYFGEGRGCILCYLSPRKHTLPHLLFQAIPQYAIPCHSSSNVVVEPSGLLELNNFTSQQLDDDETAMEQDVDSGTEDGTEPSPTQNSADRS